MRTIQWEGILQSSARSQFLLDEIDFEIHPHNFIIFAQLTFSELPSICLISSLCKSEQSRRKQCYPYFTEVLAWQFYLLSNVPTFNINATHKELSSRLSLDCIIRLMRIKRVHARMGSLFLTCSILGQWWILLSIKEFNHDSPKKALPKGKDSLVLFVKGTQFQYKCHTQGAL